MPLPNYPKSKIQSATNGSRLATNRNRRESAPIGAERTLQSVADVEGRRSVADAKDGEASSVRGRRSVAVRRRRSVACSRKAKNLRSKKAKRRRFEEGEASPVIWRRFVFLGHGSSFSAIQRMVSPMKIFEDGGLLIGDGGLLMGDGRLLIGDGASPSATVGPLSSAKQASAGLLFFFWSGFLNVF
nr:hypothetical protein CFP56_77924 [Quercus suber]